MAVKTAALASSFMKSGGCTVKLVQKNAIKINAQILTLREVIYNHLLDVQQNAVLTSSYKGIF